MADDYKAQNTTMNSYQNTETDLYASLLSAGIPRAEADPVAKTVTQYILGYVTLDGASFFMQQKGVSPEVATAITQALKGVGTVDSGALGEPLMHSEELATNF